MRPVTDDFVPFEASRVESIRSRREVSRMLRSERKVRKVRLNRPTKAERLIQESGLDQVTAQAMMAALKNIK